MEAVKMYRTQTVERPYSKADVAKLKKIGREIKEAQKDPEFRSAVREFIEYHTGAKK